MSGTQFRDPERVRVLVDAIRDLNYQDFRALIAAIDLHDPKLDLAQAVISAAETLDQQLPPKPPRPLMRAGVNTFGDTRD
jgi:hypothetical protein